MLNLHAADTLCMNTDTVHQLMPGIDEKYLKERKKYHALVIVPDPWTRGYRLGDMRVCSCSWCRDLILQAPNFAQICQHVRFVKIESSQKI